MAIGMLQKYFLIVLMGQMALSILNGLFTLPDHNAVISLLGMYGAIRGHKHSLLAVRFFVVNCYIPLTPTLLIIL